MPVYIGANGQTKLMSSAWCNVNGEKKEIIHILTSVNGEKVTIYGKSSNDKGWLFISNSNPSQLLFTLDFQTFDTVLLSSRNFSQLLQANGLYYAYEVPRTNAIGKISESDNGVYISADKVNWERKPMKIYYMDSDETSKCKNCGYDGSRVFFHNGVFYRLVYWYYTSVGQTFLMTSTDGWNWNIVYSSLLTFSDPVANVIENGDYSYIIIGSSTTNQTRLISVPTNSLTNVTQIASYRLAKNYKGVFLNSTKNSIDFCNNVGSGYCERVTVNSNGSISVDSGNIASRNWTTNQGRGYSFDGRYVYLERSFIGFLTTSFASLSDAITTELYAFDVNKNMYAISERNVEAIGACADIPLRSYDTTSQTFLITKRPNIQ